MKARQILCLTLLSLISCIAVPSAFAGLNDSDRDALLQELKSALVQEGAPKKTHSKWIQVLRNCPIVQTLVNNASLEAQDLRDLGAEISPIDPFMLSDLEFEEIILYQKVQNGIFQVIKDRQALRNISEFLVNYFTRRKEVENSVIEQKTSLVKQELEADQANLRKAEQDLRQKKQLLQRSHSSSDSQSVRAAQGRVDNLKQLISNYEAIIVSNKEKQESNQEFVDLKISSIENLEELFQIQSEFVFELMEQSSLDSLQDLVEMIRNHELPPHMKSWNDFIQYFSAGHNLIKVPEDLLTEGQAPIASRTMLLNTAQFETDRRKLILQNFVPKEVNKLQAALEETSLQEEEEEIATDTKSTHQLLTSAQPQWKVTFKNKKIANLENPVHAKRLDQLVTDLATNGPYAKTWKNYQAIQGRENRYHCHLVYGQVIVMWSADPKTNEIEIFDISSKHTDYKRKNKSQDQRKKS